MSRTLALLDAGVKMKKPVSGIAMGLISDSGRFEVCSQTDILGDEDHLGDMDFKVTGHATVSQPHRWSSSRRPQLRGA